MNRKTKENLVELINSDQFNLVEQLLKGLSVDYTMFCIREYDKIIDNYQKVDLNNVKKWWEEILIFGKAGIPVKNKYNVLRNLLIEYYKQRLIEEDYLKWKR